MRSTKTECKKSTVDWQYWFPWIEFNCNKVSARIICTKLSVYTRRAFCIQFIYVVCDWAHGVIAINHAHNVAVVGGGGSSGAFASRTKQNQSKEEKKTLHDFISKCMLSINQCWQSVANFARQANYRNGFKNNIFQCIIALDSTDCSSSIICLDEMNETTSDFGEW